MSTDNTDFEKRLFDTIVLQRLTGRVVVVSLHRPQAHNAYNSQMVRELGEVVAYAETTATIDVVILTGSGEKTFCAGADLHEAFVDGASALRNARGGYNPLQFMPRRKVWIAALNGNAFGGGLELALQCDLLVAEKNVRLALPETRHSLLPVGGGVSQLTRLLPAAVVKEMILAGTSLEAARAAELGLINRLTDRESLLEVALELANRIARNAPLAVQACNALINQGLYGDRSTLEAQIAHELKQVQQSDDFLESARAFSEKREPLWKGK
ncbi:enoyl-CoA hydratase/isomerase family protein [Rouxiella silvae]|uniref:Enoyl-CoA hydratase/isomerase family protein n=1 Tax=Rouxiella silvae TaxID=1646373 RepID=A0AA40X5L2_9GAMM|nr:enoyl-CoA hydratase-related protein [Rouxiella silvae]MBF6638779.1 enoyl-CoA hydratase/isomerase family protein [Rouxiella silvae]